jgi:hypothetical protein
MDVMEDGELPSDLTSDGEYWSFFDIAATALGELSKG